MVNKKTKTQGSRTGAKNLSLDSFDLNSCSVAITSEVVKMNKEERKQLIDNIVTKIQI